MSSLISIAQYFEVAESTDQVEPINNIQVDTKRELTFEDVNTSSTFSELANKVNSFSEPSDILNKIDVASAIKNKSGELIGKEIARVTAIKLDEKIKEDPELLNSLKESLSSQENANIRMATIREAGSLSDFSSSTSFPKLITNLVLASTEEVSERMSTIEAREAHDIQYKDSKILASTEEVSENQIGDLLKNNPKEGVDYGRALSLEATLLDQSFITETVEKIKNVFNNPLQAAQTFGQGYAGAITGQVVDLFTSLATEDGIQNMATSIMKGLNTELNNYVKDVVYDNITTAVESKVANLLSSETNENSIYKIEKVLNTINDVRTGNLSSLLGKGKSKTMGDGSQDVVRQSVLNLKNNGSQDVVRQSENTDAERFDYDSIKYYMNQWYLDTGFDWVIKLEPYYGKDKKNYLIPKLEDYIFTDTSSNSKKNQEKASGHYLPIMNYSLSGEMLNSAQGQLPAGSFSYITGQYIPPTHISLTFPNIINYRATKVNALRDWQKAYIDYIIMKDSSSESSFTASSNLKYRDFRECSYELSIYRIRSQKTNNGYEEVSYNDTYLVVPNISLNDIGFDTKQAGIMTIDFNIVGILKEG